MNNSKSRLFASLVMLSTLACGTLAQAENMGYEDPVQRQADRWGGAYVNNRPAAEARFYAEQGGYLPWQFLNNNYLLQNWQAYRLYQPPRGYQWFNVGNEFVLASLANGYIAQVLQGR